MDISNLDISGLVFGNQYAECVDYELQQGMMMQDTSNHTMQDCSTQTDSSPVDVLSFPEVGGVRRSHSSKETSKLGMELDALDKSMMDEKLASRLSAKTLSSSRRRSVVVPSLQQQQQQQQQQEAEDDEEEEEFPFLGGFGPDSEEEEEEEDALFLFVDKATAPPSRPLPGLRRTKSSDGTMQTANRLPRRTKSADQSDHVPPSTRRSGRRASIMADSSATSNTSEAPTRRLGRRRSSRVTTPRRENSMSVSRRSMSSESGHTQDSQQQDHSRRRPEPSQERRRSSRRSTLAGERSSGDVMDGSRSRRRPSKMNTAEDEQDASASRSQQRRSTRRQSSRKNVTATASSSETATEKFERLKELGMAFQVAATQEKAVPAQKDRFKKMPATGNEQEDALPKKKETEKNEAITTTKNKAEQLKQLSLAYKAASAVSKNGVVDHADHLKKDLLLC